jgi:hypothetical protein
MSEGLLQDVCDHKVESCSPKVGRFRAEVDLHRVHVQDRVCFGTSQRKWIDVDAHYEVSASASGDPGKDTCARSDIQNRSWLPQPAK